MTHQNATTSADGQALVNEERLRELCESLGGARGLTVLRDLLETYRTETRPRLTRLATAWTAGDTAAVHHEAHFLAGSSANLGLDGLARWFHEFEIQARRGALGAQPDLEAMLSARWDEAYMAYKDSLDQMERAR